MPEWLWAKPGKQCLLVGLAVAEQRDGLIEDAVAGRGFEFRHGDGSIIGALAERRHPDVAALRSTKIDFA